MLPFGGMTPLSILLAAALAAAPVRIGLAVGADSAVVGGASGVVLSGDGREIVVLPGTTLRFRTAEETGVEVSAEGFVRTAAVWEARPHAGETLVAGATAYRGTIEVFPDDTGLTVVNVLDLEVYLRGVVSREMPVADSHLQALLAQAVAARTYTAANLGRRAALGFDLWGSVEDQVYGGASAETGLADLAVASTAGVILLYETAPLRAYYHGACGGRTADIAAVWGETSPPPYLRGVDDLNESGAPFCSAAPRLAWTETYPILLVEVLDRDPSGRVSRLAVGDTIVEGDRIRRVLRRPGGGILRSTRFEVRRAGDSTLLEGAGSGHGIGMCQWGAIGRARAGLTCEDILLHYFPGARLVSAP